MENPQAKDSTQARQRQGGGGGGSSGSGGGGGGNAGSSGSGGDSGPRAVDSQQILQRGREVWNEARGLASAVEEAFDEIEGYLREQMQQRPYAALAAAAGVGYILGGGLPSRLTGLLVGWGSRIALTMAVQQLAPQARSAVSNEPASQAAAGRDR